MNTHPARRTVFTFFSAAVLVVTSGLLIAGPLNPPAGPVASTYKTLAEVEPRVAINATNTPGDADSTFKITSPGSYYLTGNILVVPGKSGIEIDADDVTIDLGGYRIGGFPGALDGVTLSGTSRRNTIVRDGSIWTMGGSGINLDVGGASGARVINLHVRACGGAGVSVGDDARLERVTSTGNTGLGIRAQNRALVSQCVVTANGSGGFSAGFTTVITGCSAAHNTGTGFSCSLATVTGSAASNNTGAGFNMGTGSSLSDCTADTNAQDGIVVQGSGVIRGCSTKANSAAGISTGSHARVVDCAAVNNEDGFSLGSHSVLSGCNASFNTHVGIVAFSNNLVVDNAASLNGSHGITAAADCLIRGNHCADNGTASADGAGVFTQFVKVRIEDNTLVGNGVGVRVLANACIIRGNTASGNTTNWSIAAGNYYLPIIDRVGAASTAVNSNAAASTLGTTDPHANISY